jgi:hypothetical protein
MVTALVAKENRELEKSENNIIVLFGVSLAQMVRFDLVF